MPIVSEGYILDVGVEDPYTKVLFGDDRAPLICTLTQVDLEKNMNKFHIMHALYSPDKGYHIYTRSGRTGLKGKISFKSCKSVEKCTEEFIRTFRNLTANVWSFRDKFEFRMGNYGVFSFGEKTPDFKIEEVANSEALIVNPTYTPIDPIFALLNLFCGEETTRAAICAMNIDIAKMPIGAISSRNISLAKDVLIEIGANLDDWDESKFRRATEKFCTYIPEKISRDKHILIDSPKRLQSRYDMLDDLANITQTLEITEKSDLSKNGSVYGSLNHELRCLQSDAPMYKTLENYFKGSHGSTHGFKLSLLSIYEVSNPKRELRYREKFGDSKRRELLVHGTRLCNWRSILEHGLMINPGNVTDKVSGKMFGHGIYWANSFSKSAQYCPISHGKKEKICLALGEVALGEQSKLLKSDGSITKSKLIGFDSVWGVGRYTPSDHVDIDGLHIPSGTLQDSKTSGASLAYDEKIIYDADQYIFKYLVIAEMN